MHRKLASGIARDAAAEFSHGDGHAARILVGECDSFAAKMESAMRMAGAMAQ
jgi:uncharacterized protein with PIN domain